MFHYFTDRSNSLYISHDLQFDLCTWKSVQNPNNSVNFFLGREMWPLFPFVLFAKIAETARVMLQTRENGWISVIKYGTVTNTKWNVVNYAQFVLSLIGKLIFNSILKSLLKTNLCFVVHFQMILLVLPYYIIKYACVVYAWYFSCSLCSLWERFAVWKDK